MSEEKPTEKGQYLLSRSLGLACVLIFAALALVVLWQVLSRYLLASPSSVSEELARILLMWLGLLGACHAHLDNRHIAIRLFPQWQPRRRELAITLICQAFACVLLVGGTKLCLTTFELQQTTPVMGLPVGLVYLVLPLSGLVMAFSNYQHYKGALN